MPNFDFTPTCAMTCRGLQSCVNDFYERVRNFVKGKVDFQVTPGVEDIWVVLPEITTITLYFEYEEDAVLVKLFETVLQDG
jgi:hypothetical protein